MTATEHGSFEAIDLSAIAPDPDALRRIPRALAIRYDVLSLSSDGNQLAIAIPDVADRDVVERIRLVTGMHVRAYHAPRDAIRARLAGVYSDVPDAPAVRAVDEIHELAVRSHASDIHVEPASGGGRVRRRIDGVLVECRALPGDLYGQVVSRMKLLAGMDIAERRQS